LNVFGVALHGKDRLRLFDPTTGTQVSTRNTTYDSWFVQADYVFAPPFQASARYEQLRVADPTVPLLKTFNANFSFLAYANIKLMLEYNRDLQNSLNYSIAGVLRAAF
jgi:hypothetical protein